MLKIVVLIVGCLPFVLLSQNSKWILASSCYNSSGSLNAISNNNLDFYEVDFSSGSPLLTQRVTGNSINNLSTRGVNETINNGLDSNGNVSFYVFVPCSDVSNMFVSDQLHFAAFDPITNKDEIFATINFPPTTASSVRNIEVVSREGFANQYYVIYKTACVNSLSNDEIRYVIVDMTTKTISSPTTISSNSLNEGMAITKKNCMNSRWLFFSKLINNTWTIYKSEISSSGISAPTNVISTSTPNIFSYGQGDLEISPDGTKLAIATLNTLAANEDILIYDLDLNSGSLSNYRYINHPNNNMFSLEFSPDSQRLYCAVVENSGIPNNLFNVSVPTSNYTINTSLDYVPFTFGNGLITLELAVDNKLYFNQSNHITQLNFISNPNANAAANLINSTPANFFGGLNLSGHDLPDQIDGDMNSLSNYSLASNADTICEGESVTLSVSGATSINWGNGISTSNPIQIVNPSTTTTYTLSAVTNCGLINDSIEIVVIPKPIATISGFSEICDGSSIDLVGSGGIYYTWNNVYSNSDSTFSDIPLQSTTVSLSVNNGYCQSDTVFQNITVNAIPEIILPTEINGCLGDSVYVSADVLSPIASYQFTWSNGYTDLSYYISPTQNEILHLSVIDSNGCQNEAEVNINIFNSPTAEFQAQQISCIPFDLMAINNSISATGYEWYLDGNFISSSVEPNFVISTPGEYDLTLIASNGTCVDTFQIINAIIGLEQPVANVFANSSVMTNSTNTTIFNAQTDGNNCITYFGDGDSLIGCQWTSIIHNYNSPGTYQIEQIVFNDNGCSDTAYFSLIITPETNIFVPNCFTPNGDESNNYFGVIFPSNTVFQSFELDIYNRWGELIFESYDPLATWDGSYHGKIVSEGVYTWTLFFKDKYNLTKQLTGFVTVLK